MGRHNINCLSWYGSYGRMANKKYNICDHRTIDEQLTKCEIPITSLYEWTDGITAIMGYWVISMVVLLRDEKVQKYGEQINCASSLSSIGSPYHGSGTMLLALSMQRHVQILVVMMSLCFVILIGQHGLMLVVGCCASRRTALRLFSTNCVGSRLGIAPSKLL